MGRLFLIPSAMAICITAHFRVKTLCQSELVENLCQKELVVENASHDSPNMQKERLFHSSFEALGVAAGQLPKGTFGSGSVSDARARRKEPGEQWRKQRKSGGCEQASQLLPPLVLFCSSWNKTQVLDLGP